jgi:fused signal recognition particle receptor
MAGPTLLSRLKRGLFMTHTELIARVGDAVKARFAPDPAVLQALEEALLLADVGPATAGELVASVREEAGRRGSEQGDVVRDVLRAEIARRLDVPAGAIEVPPGMPRVVLVVGVNGTGKTTTAAKLGGRAVAAGQSVVFAAADTFRAAAIEQLGIWAERLGAPLVSHRPGADPAAVVHDACAGEGVKADLSLPTRRDGCTEHNRWRSRPDPPRGRAGDLGAQAFSFVDVIGSTVSQAGFAKSAGN